ncbi:MAG: hypothetical protein P9L91_02305 [Candidatus Zophobacter franzmannii]|nr:hypothetical protein [Candidatus Zophobacter franzmannii]
MKKMFSSSTVLGRVLFVRAIKAKEKRRKNTTQESRTTVEEKRMLPINQ